VGFAVTGLPAYIHMPLAFICGALGGALWGFIPGWLKAKTGGHESHQHHHDELDRH